MQENLETSPSLILLQLASEISTGNLSAGVCGLTGLATCDFQSLMLNLLRLLGLSGRL